MIAAAVGAIYRFAVLLKIKRREFREMKAATIVFRKAFTVVFELAAYGSQS
jgi:hypothetical protein